MACACTSLLPASQDPRTGPLPAPPQPGDRAQKLTWVHKEGSLDFRVLGQQQACQLPTAAVTRRAAVHKGHALVQLGLGIPVEALEHGDQHGPQRAQLRGRRHGMPAERRSEKLRVRVSGCSDPATACAAPSTMPARFQPTSRCTLTSNGFNPMPTSYATTT